MKLSVFKEVVNSIQESEQKSYAAMQLGIDLVEYDTKMTHAVWTALRGHYGKEATEWIEWYIYERISMNGEILTAHDKDGKEICNTVESLWEVVEEIRKSPNFVEYDMPKPADFDPQKIINFMEKFFKTQNNDKEV